MAERTQFAAPRSNKVMCCEKAAEVATSLAVNAYTLVKAAIKHLLHGKDRKSSPATFGKLFDLPPELRDSIYEHYFSGDIGLSCRGQPRSPHAAAILLANKQLYEEAKPVMLKVATFSINLDAKHSKHPEREMTYYFDHPLQTGEHFIGDTTVFKKFRNVRHGVPAPLSVFYERALTPHSSTSTSTRLLSASRTPRTRTGSALTAISSRL